MKIIHLSDLHFGTDTPALTESLIECVTDLKPDLFIISGDFAQVASEEEFKQAADFMRALPADSFCVPGNHDVPAFNLWQRFTAPYALYKKYIDQELCPFFENSALILKGINSARRALPHWNWANGAISHAQRQALKQIFKPDETRWTICTFHHPVHKVHEMPLDVTVFGRKRTLETIHECKIDVVLTGHVHHASVTTIGNAEHQSVFISASTALSSRKRGHENGFNLITLRDHEMMIETYALDADSKTFGIRNSFQHFK